MRQAVSTVSLLMLMLFTQHAARATEGGSSYYFPGAAVTFGAAIAPTPGFLLANQMLFFNGDASKAVLRGHVNLNLESSAFYNYFSGFYTFQDQLLGGRLQIGAAIPVGSVGVNVGVDTSLGGLHFSDHDTNLADSLTSAALYWKAGDMHVKLAQTIFMPTGGYTAGNLANVGRNYWGFDTSLTTTWMNSKTGTEISLTPGIMFNTKNRATDYHSGNEWHFDYTLNQFLSKQFALGLQGYYYNQVTNDSGNGAKLGGFRGESVGIGPALFWIPDFGQGRLSLIAKWLHDLDDRHRMHGEYGQFVVGYSF